jgi:hypothetical protein
MEETILLLVKVKINYTDKKGKKEAIAKAKQCVTSVSSLSTDILSSMNETRFYILRLSYWITLTYVGYALAYFNFILRTWLSFFITFMILCYKDFCGNHYQNIKEHNKYTTLN